MREVRNSFKFRYLERQLLHLSTDSLVVKHGRDAARPVFPAPPALCFHKSRTRRSSVENGQVLMHPLSRSVHPCPQLFLLLLLSSFSSSSSRNPASPCLLSASRLRPFSFKCFFMWFRRFVSTCIFFFFPLRPTATPLALFSAPLHLLVSPPLTPK